MRDAEGPGRAEREVDQLAELGMRTAVVDPHVDGAAGGKVGDAHRSAERQGPVRGAERLGNEAAAVCAEAIGIVPVERGGASPFGAGRRHAEHEASESGPQRKTLQEYGRIQISQERPLPLEP